MIDHASSSFWIGTTSFVTGCLSRWRRAVLLTACRYLALAYAIGLAIGEAVINSNQEHWQYAPLWIIDYVIATYLLVGFWASRRGRYLPILMSAYALSAGVLYIAFFLNLDSDLPEAAREHGIVFT